MSDKQWKRTERRIAKMVGGKRTGPPVPGEPDIRTSWLSIEVKERKQLPEWLLDAIVKANEKANESQLALVMLHQTGMKGDFVILSLRDFIAWFGWEKKGE